MKKPEADEIEVSVFGPGYGECIVIHAGHNEWIVVDSCINPKTKNIAAIEHFANLGVTLDSIKLIVATHWHDDHIRGLHKLLQNCSKAQFAISEAFCNDRFLDLATIFHNQKDIGVSEFSEIWSFLLENDRYPIRAVSNKRLYRKVIDDKNFEYRVESLSPSDAAIMMSNNDILKLIPLKSQSDDSPQVKKRIKTLTPNFSAVVLLIKINEIEILLGSDLENSKDERIGWLAILNSNFDCKAELFKIPHHGSSNADNPLVWEKLLQNNPITVTTPFTKGKKIPTEQDIVRIKSYSSNAYLTAEPITKRAKTEHFIDKMMKDDIKNRKLVNPFFGHVQLRCKNNVPNDWNVTLQKNAIKLV
ncbi:MAG: MBL fold metallo-hydrolase [archaeon]|nr:MBL fold metallo-hydrolase [archaeon]